MPPTSEAGERTATGEELSRMLESTVVRYETAPNRTTIYPGGLSTVATMSTWLTADSDAFVDLRSVR